MRTIIYQAAGGAQCTRHSGNLTPMAGGSRDILAGRQAENGLSRRTFLALGCATLAQAAEPVIDIHQHTNNSGRTDQQLLAHQPTMGITKTVLLPAGRTGGLAA